MHQHKELFDLSNYTKTSKYFCNDNKKVLGKMKDEHGGTSIYEFIWLRSKMYSIGDVNGKGKSTHTGHNSYISNDEYYDTLFHIKILDIKLQESNVQNINYLHTKIIKHLHFALMISFIFVLIE